MDDMISRAEAIDVVSPLQTYKLSEGDDMLLVDKADVQMALMMLPSAQPTDAEIQKMQDIEQDMLEKAYECGKQDAAQWIPCSERLPEHGGRYLISVLAGVNRRITVAPYLPRCKAWTMTGRMAYWKVIAWMPLPEPPKEDNHETD